jgi:GrpB-like predicted nucleotidyltransferase (UPF0157 family)
MLDEPIHVVPYRPEWSAFAEMEIESLARELGSLVVALEHFGSTSVPGCDAKPIIDLLVGVREWPPPAAVVRTLEELGYVDLGEAGIPGRLYLHRRGVGGMDVNLAVTLHEGPLWRTNILVRDLLRSQPQLVSEYVLVKHAAVRAGCNTLLSYSQHKAAFMEQLVARALGRDGTSSST